MTLAFFKESLQLHLHNNNYSSLNVTKFKRGTNGVDYLSVQVLLEPGKGCIKIVKERKN